MKFKRNLYLMNNLLCRQSKGWAIFIKQITNLSILVVGGSVEYFKWRDKFFCCCLQIINGSAIKCPVSSWLVSLT